MRKNTVIVAVALLVTSGSALAAPGSLTVRNSAESELTLTCTKERKAVVTISLGGERSTNGDRDGSLKGILADASFASRRVAGAAESIDMKITGVTVAKGRTAIQFAVENGFVLARSQALFPVASIEAGRMQVQFYDEMAFDLSKHKAAITSLFSDCE